MGSRGDMQVEPLGRNLGHRVDGELLLSSLKVEPVARKIYRTSDQTRADVFGYVESFHNPRRRHSTIGYISPDGVRTTSATSLSWCLPNRQQLSLVERIPHVLLQLPPVDKRSADLVLASLQITAR